MARASFARLPRLPFVLIGMGAAAVGATILLPPQPRLLWNASASAPIGLYRVEPGVMPDVGELVIARVPAADRALAARRRYIPINVPLVKRVVAGPGDQVCGLGRIIWVNRHRVAERRLVDFAGRPMPWWRGCVTLKEGTLFLLMDDPASFDGRYFGPTSRADLVGKAKLVWQH